MLGSFSDKHLNVYQDLLQELYSKDLEEVYDFARCVRPDGSTYGTRGKCKPPNKPILAETAEQADSDSGDLPQGTKKVTVSMGDYSVDINVNARGV